MCRIFLLVLVLRLLRLRLFASLFLVGFRKSVFWNLNNLLPTLAVWL